MKVVPVHNSSPVCWAEWGWTTRLVPPKYSLGVLRCRFVRSTGRAWTSCSWWGKRQKKRDSMLVKLNKFNNCWLMQPSWSLCIPYLALRADDASELRRMIHLTSCTNIAGIPRMLMIPAGLAGMQQRQWSWASWCRLAIQSFIRTGLGGGWRRTEWRSGLERVPPSVDPT